MVEMHLKSPPFQIGDPLEDLNETDFTRIFPNEGKLQIEPVGGGLSGAKIYKVLAKEKEYLVRYSSGIFGPEGIFQEFAIQVGMGSVAVSPKNHYSNPESGIVAMDYVRNELASGRDPNILNKIPGSIESLVKLIRQVHEYRDLDGQINERIALDYVKRSHHALPDGFLEKEDAALLKRAVDTPYPAGKLTLTHNDFRSGNLLYDGTRFFLVDWELGGLGHPFYDLAYLANYQTFTPTEGEELLSLYLKKQPSSKELEDFRHLRRIAFAFSASLALPGLAEMGDAIKQSTKDEVPFDSVKELWQRIDDGSLDFDVPRDEYRISLFLLRASADY
jgi:aminoglycoside phosphotransferase (APT) family kinase protein